MIPQSEITRARLLEAFPELSKKDAAMLLVWIKRPISILEKRFENEFPESRWYAWSRAQCVSEIMEWIRKKLDIYSVEAIKTEDWWDNYYWHNTRAIYLNTGDTYSVTLLFDAKFSRFYICTWGDYVTQKETKREKFK